MPSAAGATWCSMDQRDIASARELLSAAQSTLGNPATLVQKLLGLTADDYQEVVQSLSASGASYVDIVAAYLHNLRVLYDDCGGQFPPELFSLANSDIMELNGQDSARLAAVASQQLPSKQVPAVMHHMPSSPVIKNNFNQLGNPRLKPAMSVSVPQPAKVGKELTSFDLLSSPTSTLIGPNVAYSYSSSPTSTSSLGSPRDTLVQDNWQQVAQQAAWQQAAQQAALEYQSLIARCSLQMQTSNQLAHQLPLHYSAASAHALLSAQAALSTPMMAPVAVSAPSASSAQQYYNLLASGLQHSEVHSPASPVPNAQFGPNTYLPGRPCAFSACVPAHTDQAVTSPTNGGLNYDVIKRIWDGPRVL